MNLIHNLITKTTFVALYISLGAFAQAMEDEDEYIHEYERQLAIRYAIESEEEADLPLNSMRLLQELPVDHFQHHINILRTNCQFMEEPKIKEMIVHRTLTYIQNKLSDSDYEYKFHAIMLSDEEMQTVRRLTNQRDLTDAQVRAITALLSMNDSFPDPQNPQ